jgi:molybdate transport system ATP-binding protein
VPPVTSDRDIDTAGELEVVIRCTLGRFQLDVSFASTSRRIVLFGPSGGGKTATLRALAGIMRPNSGVIRVNGETLYDSATRLNVPSHKRRVGYVPQGYALFPHLTIEQSVAYGLSGVPKKRRAATVREMMELVGLAGLESHYPHQLSGGQQQRVAVARALAPEPRIVLLDEPFSAVDAPLRAELRRDLAALQQRSSATLVLVSHDLADAFALGDFIVAIDQGRVLQQGVRDDLYYRPQSKKVAELVGVRNILDGHVVSVQESSTYVECADMRLHARTDAGAFVPGDRVAVCIRATQLMIRRPEDTGFSERLNALSGSIVDEAALGETHRLSVRLAGSSAWSDLEVELPGYAYFRLGLDQRKEVDLSVRPELVHLIRQNDSA